MAGGAALGLPDVHLGVAFHALDMVGPKKSRFSIRILVLDRRAVTVAASRGIGRGRAVVVAPHAERRFFMKILGHAVVVYLGKQGVDNFSVGKDHGPVFLLELVDHDAVRNLGRIAGQVFSDFCINQ